MIVVGLAGRSGAGKSTVAGMFGARGAACLDVDGVAREIVRPGSPVLAEIERAFGGEYLLADGGLDRRKLGRKVFSDPAGLELLNRITHPALVRKVIEQVFFNNPFVSSRQIPARYRLRDDLPLTVNAKVDYRAIAAEPLAAEDIILHLEETNLFLGKWSLE